MKPYFNDDFSKALVERVAYSMMEADKKCSGTGAGKMCPVHGDADCNSSKQNRKEEVEIEEGKNKEGKEQGADGKACWKGYKYAGTSNGKDKCVKAGYEMEGEVELDEKAPPSAKAERMVKHIKKSYSKDGKLTDTEKSKAYGAAWKAYKKEEWEKPEKEEKGEKKHKEGKAEEKKEKMKEARNMPGNQEKIDANKNGKVDAGDFAILRNRKSKKTVKEMWELAAEAKANIEVMPEIDDSDPNNIKKKGKKEVKDK